MRAPRPPPLDKGPDRRTGLRRHRRDFRRPELSFLVSETRTGAGRGREGRRALGAARSYGPILRRPALTSGRRARRLGSRWLGSGSRRRSRERSRRGVGGRQTQTGPAAGELPPGPRRSGRTPGVAQEIPGPPPPAPAQRHTEVQGGGAVRPHPGAGPSLGPPPPWARPHVGPPPRGPASAGRPRGSSRSASPGQPLSVCASPLARAPRTH